MSVGARIQKRRGTAAQWTAANPVLADGEEGYEKDTGKSKIGDGATAWASLPYFVPGNATFVAKTRSGGDGNRALRDRSYRAWDAALADLTTAPNLYIFGHSVVQGTNASDQPHAFAPLVRGRVTAARSGVVTTISGNPGNTTTQLLALTPPASFTGLAAGSVALVVIMGMLNDYLAGVASATTKTNLQAIIAAFKANAAAAPGCNFLILSEWVRGDVTSPAEPWANYTAAAQAVADTDVDVNVLDLGARMGSAATASNTLGLFHTDQTHPVDKGHALIADLVSAEILRGHNPTLMVNAQTTILAGAPPVANTNWTGVTRDTDGALLRFTDTTQNADITYMFLGAAGTYSVALDHRQQANAGKYDIYLDGVKQGAGGTWDGYAASNADAYNVVTGFSVPAGGVHTLRLVMATKNASSSAYAGAIRGVYVTRTGN